MGLTNHGGSVERWRTKVDGIVDWTRGENNDGWLADWMWGNTNGMATERRMHGLRVCGGGRGKE